MRKLVLTAAAALLLCGSLSAQDGQPPQKFRAEEFPQVMDAYIREIVQTWQLPGMAVGISLNNETVLAKGYGYKELRPRDGIGFRGVPASDRRMTGANCTGVLNDPLSPIDGQTLFHIGSISKSFTATVMGQLVSEGKVKWTDTVKNILPDFRFYDKWVEENMQVMDIMTHRTGLGEQVGTYFPNLGYGREDCYRMMGRVKPAYSFRGDYQYNNSTFLIAEKIIEKVTGRSWEQNVRERILEKLDMKHTGTTAGHFSSARNAATPHDYSYSTPALCKAPFPDLAAPATGEEGGIVTLPLYADEQALNWLNGVGPAGSITSNVTDMLRYVQMHMNNGFVVDGEDTVVIMPEKAVRKLHEGVTVTSQNDHRTTLYAQGWFVEQNDRYRLYFHTGTTWGMTALCFYVPEIRLCGVVLVNAEAGSSPRYAVMNRAIDYVMEAPFKDYNRNYFQDWIAGKEADFAREQAEKKPLEASEPLPYKAVVGRYVKDGLFGDAEIVREKDGLYIIIGKMKFKNRLVHVTGDEYRFRSDGHEFPLVFRMDAQRRKATGFTVQFNYGEEDSLGGWTRGK